MHRASHSLFDHELLLDPDPGRCTSHTDPFADALSSVKTPLGKVVPGPLVVLATLKSMLADIFRVEPPGAELYIGPLVVSGLVPRVALLDAFGAFQMPLDESASEVTIAFDALAEALPTRASPLPPTPSDVVPGAAVVANTMTVELVSTEGLRIMMGITPITDTR